MATKTGARILVGLGIAITVLGLLACYAYNGKQDAGTGVKTVLPTAK